MAKKTVSFGKEDANTVVCFISDGSMPRDYMGKAKCHENDSFSIKIGQRLSYYRAMQKYAKAKAHKLQEEITYIARFYTYVIPKKYTGRISDAIRARAHTYSGKKIAQQLLWKQTVEDYKMREEEYLKGLASFAKQMEEKKKSNNQ